MLPPGNVFITHHHSDHLVDYPNLLLLAWHNGSGGLRQPITWSIAGLTTSSPTSWPG